MLFRSSPAPISATTSSTIALSSAAEKLAQAAHIIGQEPAAIQLRYLQTVNEIASENNSTTIFPIPIDLFRGFMERLAPAQADDAGSRALPERTAGERLPAVRSKGKAKV